MQEFAKRFYRSKAWRDVRAYVFRRDMGLCTRCGCPGEIVHHKTPLTQGNITDPYVTLSPEGLETLCRACHAIEHEGRSPTAPGLCFDGDGNLVELAERKTP